MVYLSVLSSVSVHCFIKVERAARALSVGWEM